MATRTSGCSTSRPRKFPGLRRTNGRSTAAIFLRTASTLPGPRMWMATPISICTISCRREKLPSLPLSKGREQACGGTFRVQARWHRACFTTITGRRSRRSLGLSTWRAGNSHQITHSLVAGVRSRGHGRAVSGALSQPRRQVDDLGVRLCALQHGAQRAECRHGLCARRPGGADGEFVQPLRSVHGQPGLHGDRAQLSRLDRVWQGVSARESVRHGRRRSAGRAGGGGLHQADRLSRSQEDRR